MQTTRVAESWVSASDGFLPVWAGSGWSLALPGLWMVRGSGGGSTRHPLESFQTGRGYESTPRAKVQTTTWPGSQGPAFRLPSAAQPDRAPKSPHAPLLSLPAPAEVAPGSEHIIPTSKSFLAPSPFPQAGSAPLLGTPKPLDRLANLEHCFSPLEGGPQGRGRGCVPAVKECPEWMDKPLSISTQPVLILRELTAGVEDGHKP